MDIGLITLLKQTGFTEKEARIYLALLELGKGDVTEIAQKAELKRSIVYVIVDELIEKGYASKLPNRTINTYQTVDPGAILNAVRGTARNFSEMLPYLRTLANKTEKRPKIHFIDTKPGIFKVYEDMNAHHDQFFISSYSRIEQHFPGEIEKWVTNYKKGHYHFQGRHLIPDNPADLATVKEFTSIGQKVKIIPSLKESFMDFSVYGNKIGITSFEKIPFIVVIESQGIVDSIMPIFEIAWRSGKSVR